MLQCNKKQTTFLEFFTESLKVLHVDLETWTKNGDVSVKKSDSFTEKNYWSKTI